MRKIYVLLFLLLSSSRMLATDYSSVIFHFADGTQSSYLFADKPKVAIQGDDVTITAGTSELTCEFSDIQKITFGTVTDGISAISSARPPFLLNGSTISFGGMSPNEPVEVFSLSGTRLKSARADASGSLSLELSDLGPQIVIVKSKSSTFKTVVR